MADRWFERRGERIVLISRCLPIIRTFISLPAGIARMPFWRFTIYTAIGCLPWVLGLTLIGVQVGAKWEEWHDRLHFLDYVVIAGILGRSRVPPRALEARPRDRMSSGSGLPGEERFLEWAHRRAYESRVGPRLHALESGVPYASAVLVYALLGALAVRKTRDHGPAP